MLISELQNKLEQIKNKKGDLDVKVYDYESNYFQDIFVIEQQLRYFNSESFVETGIV